MTGWQSEPFPYLHARQADPSEDEFWPPRAAYPAYSSHAPSPAGQSSPKAGWYGVSDAAVSAPAWVRPPRGPELAAHPSFPPPGWPTEGFDPDEFDAPRVEKSASAAAADGADGLLPVAAVKDVGHHLVVKPLGGVAMLATEFAFDTVRLGYDYVAKPVGIGACVVIASLPPLPSLPSMDDLMAPFEYVLMPVSYGIGGIGSGLAYMGETLKWISDPHGAGADDATGSGDSDRDLASSHEQLGLGAYKPDPYHREPEAYSAYEPDPHREREAPPPYWSRSGATARRSWGDPNDLVARYGPLLRPAGASGTSPGDPALSGRHPGTTSQFASG